MQEQGYDTVDANRELGLPDDAREYTSVQNILADLDIKSIRLMVRLIKPQACSSEISPEAYAGPCPSALIS